MTLSKCNLKRYYSDSRKTSAKNNWYIDYYYIHFIICYVFCFNAVDVILFVNRFAEHKILEYKINKLTIRLEN